MGKDLKGKELGRGLSQKKDGKYLARFTSVSGKRLQSTFETFKEARQWLAKAQVDDAEQTACMYDVDAGKITLDEWFDRVKKFNYLNISKGTMSIYIALYRKNASPVIGGYVLSRITPADCDATLMQSERSGRAVGTIKQLKSLLSTLFELAINNTNLLRNPMKSVTWTGRQTVTHVTKHLRMEEQIAFLEACSKSSHGDDFRFVLETGLRVSELRGITVDDVDLDKKQLKIVRNLSCYPIDGHNKWIAAPPKTNSGYRLIPLTETAVDILRKKIDELKQRIANGRQWEGELTYTDIATGRAAKLQLSKLLFVGATGKSLDTNSYNVALTIVCRNAGIEQISMHKLRHTFATRVNEAGGDIKALQQLLGHSSFATTMNTYVHIDDEREINTLKKMTAFMQNGAEVVRDKTQQ